MLIVALVLAVVSLAALVTAVVTSNELIAWACIGFSALGVLLLIIDAIRDRQRRPAAPVDSGTDRTEVIAPVEATEVIEPVESDEGPVAVDYVVENEPADHPEDTDYSDFVEDGGGPESADETLDEEIIVEDHPDEVVYDDPEHDIPSDDESSYPLPAEVAAVHIVTEDDVAAEAAEDEVYADPGAAVDSGEASYTVTYAEVPPADESPTVTAVYAASDSDEAATVIYSGEQATESGADESGADESGDDRRDH